MITHRGMKNKKGKYFGPFTSKSSINKTIETLQKVFLIRNCSDNIFNTRSRPCLQYQIKRCSAPCVNYISKADYLDGIQNVINFLSGKSHDIKKILSDKMYEKSENQNYEEAATLRNQIYAISNIITSQNINYQNLKNLDLIYIAIPCKDEDLELVLNSLKKINCKGLNITIPHKEKVFNLCSEISPIANKLKAINTLKLNSEKEWSATNTDVEGFIYPLKNLNLAKKKSIVLGSGGAARSVIQGLINLNLSKISVISRNKSSLDELIKNFDNQIQLQGLLNSDDKAQILIREADLIVNTTPAGMKTTKYENNAMPYGEAFWRSLNSQTIVYDLIYNPSPTPLLKFSAKKGCMTINGLEMLIAQGMRSISFWTDGLEVPFHVMNDALKKYL